MRLRLHQADGSVIEKEVHGSTPNYPPAWVVPAWTGQWDEDQYGRRPRFGQRAFALVAAHDDYADYQEVQEP